MRGSYFLHPLIEGINKDGSDTVKNFLGEDRKEAGVGSRAGDQEARALPSPPLSQD